MADKINKAVVTRSTGSWYQLRRADGSLIDARIKGKFRTKGIKTTNPVAVGDLVNYEETNEENPIIVSIADRKNYIVRKSVNLSKQSQIIAANMDFAILVVTVANPKTSNGFIDRFLVTAEAYHIPTVLVFNKIDILSDSEKEEMKHLISIYEGIGYSCIQTSATEGIGLEKVKALLRNKVTMLSGHSGAGKSSLINAIDPSIAAKVGDISSSHFKGKHTTTFAEMFALNFGGDIIDTPGIKGFGLVDLDKDELNHYFVEMQAYRNDCKFSNCKHINEPKCAIKQAIENGEIAIARYESYLAIMADDDVFHYRTDSRYD